ncbi:MAG: hypothetical protein ACI8Y7_000302 [Candidatus Woesearchaeota archaeon]|jgi:hypothetical protein
MSTNNKAQITMFMILAVVIVGIAGLLLILTSDASPDTDIEITSKNRDQTEFSFESCLMFAGQAGLQEFSVLDSTPQKLCYASGVHNPQKEGSFFACDSRTYGLTNNTIDVEMSRFIEKKFISCVKDVDLSHAQVSVFFGRDDVQIELNETYVDGQTIQPIRVTLPVRYKQMYNFLFHSHKLLPISGFDITQDHDSILECNYYSDRRCFLNEFTVIDKGTVVTLRDKKSQLFFLPFEMNISRQ